MSQLTPLLQHLHDRFREAFGTPSSMLELDSQWTLRPDDDRLAPALFLLVNGSYEKPAVWMFDPYDGGDNVWRTAVESEDQIDRIIELVSKRLASATLVWSDGHGSDGHGIDGQKQ
jgi:hypothetical protein